MSRLLSEQDGAAAVSAFERGRAWKLYLEGEEVVLNRDDVLVETMQKRAWSPRRSGV